SFPGYGVPDDAGGMLPWSWAEGRLASAHNYWVATAGPGPHASPVWGLWQGGGFLFSCGQRSRKARDLAQDPRVVVHLESGDEVRALYNGMIDKHPAAIAYCVDEADVVGAVGFAREREVRLAVRCGGHNGAGLGSVDDGLVLDLSEMNNVTVDPAAKMVRVQGGALLQDVDRATHEHGFAVPAGIISTTGIGGLTLGGGV